MRQLLLGGIEGGNDTGKLMRESPCINSLVIESEQLCKIGGSGLPDVVSCDRHGEITGVSMIIME